MNFQCFQANYNNCIKQRHVPYHQEPLSCLRILAVEPSRQLEH